MCCNHTAYLTGDLCSRQLCCKPQMAVSLAASRASSADFHGRNPAPAQRLEHLLTSVAEAAVSCRREPASCRALAPGLLVQQLIDMPIGKLDGHRNGERHTVAHPAPESSGFASAVVINP